MIAVGALILIYVQYVKQQYQEWRHDGPSQTVCFEDDKIILDLPDPTVVDHWKIVPMTPPQVVVIKFTVYPEYWYYMFVLFISSIHVLPFFPPDYQRAN